MIIQLDTNLLKAVKNIDLNGLVFLSMVLDKNQKKYTQDVYNVFSLINSDTISYLISQGLVTSIERSDSIIYQPTDKLINLLEPPKDYFNLFYDMYPIYVIRKDGTKSFLRSNVNKCRKLYNMFVGNSVYIAEHINDCLKFEIEKKMKTGNMCYMKTMYRWLQDHQWEETEEEMEASITQNTTKAYGTELF